ncbi:hypothetical protein [Enterobacter cancerogenus]
MKTYYIHRMAFGSTQNPGYGHVPVVHADDFEKLRAKLEAAEKRIAELTEKPIGWTDEQELRDVEKLGCGYLFNANPITQHTDPRRVILLYAAAAEKGE